MEKNNITAQRIKEAMNFNNLTQAQIVSKTGIPKSSLSSYLSGKYTPKQTNLYKLAKCLGVAESWLMGYDAPNCNNQEELTKINIIHFLNEKDLKQRQDIEYIIFLNFLKENGFLEKNEDMTKDEVNRFIKYVKANKQFIMNNNKR